LQDERENLPSIVGLPSALERKLIAPLHENTAAAAICKSGNREIAEPLFDLFDLFPVVGSGALAQIEEIGAQLVAVQEALQRALRPIHLARHGCIEVGDEFR
jgi:hypothetical protein